MKALIDRLRGVERDAVQRPSADGEVFYIPQGNEVEVFKAAYAKRLPVMLKGPTGCGKTRFLEFMAHSLDRPLVSVACHEDLTSSDLVGRFLLQGEETVWQDGPLTKAVKEGAICYLDEIVEARTDTTVVIHPLTDHRRQLPLEKKGQVVDAHEDFMLVISYNPGYQTVLKDLKPSTKQRFVGLQFDYPGEEIERQIVSTEAGGLEPDLVERLVRPGARRAP
jgi:nitric oxide reductase NorQ protein